MRYLAHIAEDSGEQTLKEHLTNVADLSAEFAKALSLIHI